MKLTKTKKFRVLQDFPNLHKGFVTESDLLLDYDNYPHLFAPIYEFEDGTGVCINDTVFRIKPDGYSRLVKSLKLQQLHIDGDVEVFPTRESAEEKLKTEEKQTEKRLEESNIISVLQNIQVISNLKDFDSLSLAEIKKKFEQINKLASVWK